MTSRRPATSATGMPQHGAEEEVKVIDVSDSEKNIATRFLGSDKFQFVPAASGGTVKRL